MNIYDIEETLKKEIENISEYIFNHPELGNEEFQSSQYLVDVLKSHGFDVEYPYCDIPTSFRAEFKKGEGRKVAFLAEYDALPGYGPNKDEVAHACGHNWIAASCLGAAITLSKLENISGTIVVIGTPAEETTGGKCELVMKHAFDDIDAAIQMHLGAENNINVVTLAMDSIEFTFKGKASHAAAYPELGVNALDAVQLTFAGINALRQHMKADARVAGIITDGGMACNIVPDHASCQFYIRAAQREYVQILTEKIINCAKGACLMTGCEMDYRFFENSFDDLVYNEELRTDLKKSLNELGICSFVEDDSQASGSSDIGNVSHVCPTVYCELDTQANPKVYAHNEDFLEYVHGTNAEETLHIACKAMATTALHVLEGMKL
ncbi:M20 family metallopeptidase [Floccifex sp.]|uniref:M20 family metallopeptidase n=1 Tax=Floccifex sp. TaxID=2815810 RepID=UPI002A755B84|nr:M20 family metallopeptidase [Floccifex sp.]MDY2957503.1 M20 family metallopeptidase [Floccifex sp.]